MLTEKDYCDYETRNELIKLGYPAHLYDNTEVDKILGAILLYEAQKWLREEKGIIVELNFAYMDEKQDKYYWVQIVTDIRFDDENYIYECDTTKFEEFKGYEKALSECIKQAVKILKGE